MPESSSGFADGLLAGIDGDLDKLMSEIDIIADGNRKFRQAWGLVEVSRGICSLSTFEARWPDLDAQEILSDPEVAALVEEVGERTDLQVLAQQNLAMKTLDAALKVISVRLDSSDCGIHHARDVADLAIRLETASTKGAKLVVPPRRRSFSIINRIATVVSPEHPDGVDLRVSDVWDGLRLFRAMRCVEVAEFHAVWDVLHESLFVGSLTLEGW